MGIKGEVHYSYRKCPVCGGKFVVERVGNWCYKALNRKNYRYELLCSYGCMRKRQEELENEKSLANS